MPCKYHIDGKTFTKDEFLNYVKKQPLEESSNVLAIAAPISAPFITDTNKYVSLALKTALKEAVKADVDKLSWTTGEQQNDRYDLSRQVSKIEVEAVAEAEGVYFVDIELTSGQIENLEVENGIVREGKFKDEKLEDVVGKDVTEKILSTPKGEKITLREGDLKVGGKGMKGFYGSLVDGKKGIVGSVAEKLFKQKLGTTDIIIDYVQEDGVGLIPNEQSTQPSIEITPELKAEVGQGIPMFMLPPRPTRPSKPKYNIDKEPITKAVGELIYGKYQNHFKLNGGDSKAAIETTKNELDKIWPGYKSYRVKKFLDAKTKGVDASDIHQEFKYLKNNTDLSLSEIAEHVLYFSNRDATTTNVLKIYETQEVSLKRDRNKGTFGGYLMADLGQIMKFLGKSPAKVKYLFTRQGSKNEELNTKLVYEKAKIFAALNKANLSQIKLNRLIKKLSTEDKRNLLKVLRGEDSTIFEPEGLSKESRKEILDTVSEMRSQIKQYTELFRASGYLNAIQNTIFLENEGYATVAYRIFHDDDWVKTVRKYSPQIWENGKQAVAEYLSHESDRIDNLVKMLEHKNDAVKAKLREVQDRIGEIESMAVTTPDEKSELRSLKGERDELLTAIRANELKINKNIETAKTNRDYLSTDEGLTNATLVFMEKYSGKKNAGITSSGDLKIDLTIFKKKKDLPEAIRELLGEYGIQEVLEVTISKMATSYHHIQSQQLLYEFNESEPIFTKKKGEHGFDYEINLTERYGHLRDLFGADKIYTTRELKEDFFDTVIDNSEGIGGYIASVNAIAKLGMTVYNPPTQVRNYMGNYMFMLANGNLINQRSIPIFLELYNETITQFQEVVDPLKKEERLDFIQKLIGYNLINANVDVREINVNLGKLDGSWGRVRKRLETTKGGEKLLMINELAFKMYRAGDEVFKAASFKLEADKYARAWYGKTYKELVKTGTEAEIKRVEDRSAIIVRGSIPNYNEAYRLALAARKTVLFAPFVTFMLETIRTRSFVFKLMAEELADPKLRKYGVERGFGTMAAGLITYNVSLSVASLGYGVISLINKLAGLGSGEDEDKLKKMDDETIAFMKEEMLPPFAVDVNVVFKDGLIQYQNNEFLNPYSPVFKSNFMKMSRYFKRASRKREDEAPFTEYMEDYIKGIASLFGTISTTEFGASFARDWIANDNGWGGKIFDEDNILASYESVFNKAVGKSSPITPGGAKIGISFVQKRNRLQEIEEKLANLGEGPRDVDEAIKLIGQKEILERDLTFKHGIPSELTVQVGLRTSYIYPPYQISKLMEKQVEILASQYDNEKRLGEDIAKNRYNRALKQLRYIYRNGIPFLENGISDMDRILNKTFVIGDKSNFKRIPNSYKNYIRRVDNIYPEFEALISD